VWYDINMFCIFCGNKKINGDCLNCFKNPNALKEFEEEDD